MRKAAGDTLKVGEDPIAPLVMQVGERVVEVGTVIHEFPFRARPEPAAGSF
jgi:hypothetical protein